MTRYNKFIIIFDCFWDFWYFKNSYIDKVKNIKPINLELGQIDNDLKVGDKNKTKDKVISKFFSILSNLKVKHL